MGLVIDHREEFRQIVRGATGRGIARATTFLFNAASRSVAVSNPGVSFTAKQVLGQADAQIGPNRKSGLVTIFKTRRDGTAHIGQIWFDRDDVNSQKSHTYYLSPSQPGEPPRSRTGFGRMSILMDVDQPALEGRVGIGTNGIYMLYWELGVRGVRRPWLQPALLNNRQMIGQLALLGGKA